MIETNAVGPSTRAGGRWSNFSISGKRMSTCGRAARARAARASRAGGAASAGRTRGRRRARARRSPRLPGWRRSRRRRSARRLRLQVLDAAEVAEHLLLRLLAHRAGVEEDQVGVLDVGGRLVALRRRASTSAILAESYSFIWQPKVLMKTFVRATGGRRSRLGPGLRGRVEEPRRGLLRRRRPGLAGGLSRRQDPDVLDEAERVERVVHEQLRAGQRAGQRPACCCVADPRAGREARRLCR